MSRPEQRRYSRQATCLAARLLAPGLTLEGRIRDFCRAGLLLVPTDRVAAAALVRGAAVEIELDGGATLSAKVARIDAAGLGLQVAALSDEAIEALRSAAVAGASLPTAGATPSVSASARQAMQRDCQRLLAAALNEVLDAFFAALPAALDAASDALAGTTQRSLFAGVGHRIVADRAGVIARFDAALRESMRHPNRRRDRPPPSDALPELALVDDEQFEEWLCLSAIVNRIEADHSTVLAELRARYGAMRAMALDRGSDPFGPEAIMRAFQQALAPLALPVRVGTVVHETFGAALYPRCAALYAALSEALAPLAAPKGPRRVTRRPSRPRPQAATPADEDAIDPPTRPMVRPEPDGDHQPGAVPARGRPSASPNGPAGGAGPVVRIRNAAASAGARPAAGGPGASGRGGRGRTGRSSPPPPVVPLAAPASAGSSRTLFDLIGRLQRATGTPHSAGTADTEEPAEVAAPGRVLTDPAALPGLLDALLAAAGSSATGAPHDGDPATPGLSDRLSPALGALPLAPAQRQRIESATGLIGRALGEPASDSAIRRLLRRLEAPLLRLALRDERFLASTEHPARRLVDLIEQCAIATDDRGRFEDPKLDRLLNRVVDRVVSEVDGDPAVLERNARVIERLLGPLRVARRHRVERLQQAFEAREAIRSARLRVDAALAATFGRDPVPLPVHALLDAGWTQHLVLAEIRGAVRSPDDGGTLAALAGLASALRGDAAVAAGDARRLVRTAIEPPLRALGAEPERIDACLGELGAAIDALERDGTLPEAVPLPAAEAPAGPPDEATLAFARRLRVGDWWQMDDARGARVVQLVWTSTPPRACGFASRSAGERHELTLDAFAERVAAGRMRPCTDQDRPLLERSELVLLDEGWRALRRRALCDAVTGLPGRRAFLRALGGEALADLGALPGDGDVWVGLVRFDTLRTIGASCGVDAAESLVRDLAVAARKALGNAALLARHGDDTLALAVPAPAGDRGENAVSGLLERLRDHPFEHGEARYRIGVSIGLVRFARGADDAEEAVGRAESACAAAAEQGRNRMQVYDDGGRALRSQEALADWAGRLDRMLEHGGLYLRCQRIEPLGDDPALGSYHEVLLGIEPIDGSESPAEFVQAVERLGRSHELDLWVMRRTLDWIEANPQAFVAAGGFAINVSPRSLDGPEIRRLLDERLERLGDAAARLTFELTETSAIACYGAAQAFIRQVRRHGCRVSLDDFGSGYASYAHLKNLRTDVLKIDGAFVRDLATDAGDLAMVRSMVEVARSLGMRTVAEYVESEAIRERLREIGVDYGQGWAIHAPCPMTALEAPGSDGDGTIEVVEYVDRGEPAGRIGEGEHGDAVELVDLADAFEPADLGAVVAGIAGSDRDEARDETRDEPVAAATAPR